MAKFAARSLRSQYVAPRFGMRVRSDVPPTATAETRGEKTVHYADKDGLLRASTEPVVDINAHYTDVSFSGSPAQCDEGDGTCEALTRVFEWKSSMGFEESHQYKYIMDMGMFRCFNKATRSLTNLCRRQWLVRPLPSPAHLQFCHSQEHDHA